MNNFTLGGSFGQIPFFHFLTFHTRWSKIFLFNDIIFPVWTILKSLLPFLWFFLMAELELSDSFDTQFVGVDDLFALWATPEAIWPFLWFSLWQIGKYGYYWHKEIQDGTERFHPPLIEFEVFQIFWVSDVRSSPLCTLAGDHHFVHAPVTSGK